MIFKKRSLLHGLNRCRFPISYNLLVDFIINLLIHFGLNIRFLSFSPRLGFHGQHYVDESNFAGVSTSNNSLYEINNPCITCTENAENIV